MNNITSSKKPSSKYFIAPDETALRTFGGKGKIIGKISGNTARKDVSGASAFLKYPEPAIAWTKAALNFMRERGVVYIDVLDTDSGIHYKTTLQKYFDGGEYFDGGNAALWGEQLKLNLTKFAQWRDPAYMAQAGAEAEDEPLEDDAPLEDVKPLRYKSRAPSGITLNGAKVKSVKQLSLFGRGFERGRKWTRQ